MPYDDPILKELSGYFEAKESSKRERADAWATAIGLQKVDGLTPSPFLIETAKEHIEGKITQSQAQRRIRDYYAAKEETAARDPRLEEPDKVSERIVAVINERGFEFTPEYYLSLHKKIFAGLLPTAGKLRTINIAKREWILRDESVTYGSKDTLMPSLVRNFQDERDFDYGGASLEEIIPHFAHFIAQIWQVHPFMEGNTRTTAVFAIKYLHALGFRVTNNMFCENSWYFRNALVRANYADYARGVKREWCYLETFLRNLLLGETTELKNRYLLIGFKDAKLKPKSTPKSREKSREKILRLLKKNAAATQQEIAAEVGITVKAVEKNLKQLKQEGLLKRIGPDKGGHWQVTTTLKQPKRRTK